ncbi:MAG: PqiC family protein [Luteolibacter sp.]
MNRFLILILASLLAACSQSSKSFYMLTASGPVPSGGGVAIGVGPVSLAEYIDRPNLVTQQAPNQLAVAEDHRWAGDLSASVARVVAANLGRNLKTGNVRTYPWLRDDEIRYQVTLDIRQLHSEADGYALIEAGWRAYQLPERRVVASKTFTDREPLDTDGYNASVAAQSRLIGRLSDDIAASLR